MVQILTKARCATTGKVESRTFVAGSREAARARARSYYGHMCPKWWQVVTQRHVVAKACTFNGETGYGERALQ